LSKFVFLSKLAIWERLRVYDFATHEPSKKNRDKRRDGTQDSILK